MSFNFKQINIDGVYIIHPHKFEDERGLYEKHFELNTFRENGIEFNVTESSDLYSKKGSVRGLHYQLGKSQAKLVRVIKGKVFDVIVDLRQNSLTFGETFTIILDEYTNTSVYIPKGFAHGFLALEDCVFSYHCDGRYEPSKCGGIRFDDQLLSIDWPLEEIGGEENLIISEKDMNLPSFEETKNLFSNN